MALNILFMGTTKFSAKVLENLYNSKHRVICVYSQPPSKKKRGQKILPSPVQTKAENYKIQIRIPNDLKNPEELDFLRSIKPDVVVVAAYGKLIPKEYLDLPNILFLNLHASLLPKFRGAAPIERSILQMEKETGISIMKIVPKLDEGPYTRQIKVKLNINTTTGELSENLAQLGSQALIHSLNDLEKNNINFIEQDHKNSTYAKKIQKSETKINWQQDAEKVIAQINAFNPNPGAWFLFKNKRYKVLKAVKILKSDAPGVVIDGNLTIACKKNSIQIISLQKEGKQVSSAKEFLLGNEIKKGTKLS